MAGDFSLKFFINHSIFQKVITENTLANLFFDLPASCSNRQQAER